MEHLDPLKFVSGWDFLTPFFYLSFRKYLSKNPLTWNFSKVWILEGAIKSLESWPNPLLRNVKLRGLSPPPLTFVILIRSSWNLQGISRKDRAGVLGRSRDDIYCLSDRSPALGASCLTHPHLELAGQISLDWHDPATWNFQTINFKDNSWIVSRIFAGFLKRGR